MANDHVSAVYSVATSASPISDHVTAVYSKAAPTAALGVTLGPDVSGLEPFTTQTVTATVSGATGVSLTISQTGGSAVTIVGTNPVTTSSTASWTYKTPGVAAVGGDDVQFTVIAQKTGFTDTVVNIDHFVYPASIFDYDSRGVLRGLPITLSLTPNPIPTSTMPTVDLTDPYTGKAIHWVYGEDFLTDVALGDFTTILTGPDLGHLDPATPAGAAYATSWKAKQEESPDTSGFAKYSAVRTMSASNSVLRIADRIIGGQAYGGSIKPLLPVGVFGSPDFFGIGVRIDFKMRHTNIVGNSFGCVGLGINVNHWPQWGEPDYPEGALGNPVKGNMHYAQATNSWLPFTGFGNMTDWHVYSWQWIPAPTGTGGRNVFSEDGTVVLDSTDRVAGATIAGTTVQLGWLIQTGSNGITVAPGSQGDIEIDWIAIATAT